ncbi:DUF2637 domain-containing protein [Streptomyces noursei]|uniref:DUF2637 domain-containing protein n=1 Tax=Streptomyces noursei TaxID=1971 RepID=UPI0035D74210
MVSLASVGFILSYDALRQVAVAIHVRPVLSYLFPVVVDGFIAYGVRAILLLRDRPFLARLYAWILFFAATGASLWANALHAITLNREAPSGPSGPSALHLADSVVGVLSTLAPLALAGSVHLWIIMARTADSSVPDRRTRRPGPVRSDPAGQGETRAGNEASALGASLALPLQPGPSRVSGAGETPADEQDVPVATVFGPSGSFVDEEAGESSTVRSSAPSASGGPGGPEPRDAPDSGPVVAPSGGREAARSEGGTDHAPDQNLSVPDCDDAHQDRESAREWMEELLPIAREASRRTGRISRSAVQEAVRARHPISNERLGALLAQLRQEEEEAGTRVPARTGSGLW